MVRVAHVSTSEQPGSLAARASTPTIYSVGHWALRLVALLLISISMVRTAWIGDDALITLRTALNLSHGWGPGFNATEAVAPYTHPLWFLMWLIAGALSQEWIASIFALSLLCALGSVAIVLWSARTVLVVVLASGALLGSSAFIDYSTSGLENPLAYLLLGLTVLQVRSIGGGGALRWAVLGLTVAGLVLTRMDLLLITLPIGVWIAWNARRNLRCVLAAVVGLMTPLVVWAMWSWVNYSAVLPNTMAAKTNVEIPRADLLLQGVRYLEISLTKDLGTFVVLLLGSMVILVWGLTWQRWMFAGVGLYLAYVIFVGGDFMVGRFLAVPVYTVVLLAVLVSAAKHWGGRRPVLAPLTSGVAVVIILATIAAVGPVPTALTRNPGPKWEGIYGIVDERGVYAEQRRSLHAWLEDRPKFTGAFDFVPVASANPWGLLAEYDSAAHSWPARTSADEGLPTEVGTVCWLGATALVTGPRVHWVDTCALADRFLAEMPARGSDWRIGHFKRDIPEGYVQAIAANDPQLVVDPIQRDRLIALWHRIR